MAAARSVMFHGLTKMAPAPSDCAAPANSLNTSTPAHQMCHSQCSDHKEAKLFVLYVQRQVDCWEFQHCCNTFLGPPKCISQKTLAVIYFQEHNSPFRQVIISPALSDWHATYS